MRKKLLSILVLTILVALTLAGCSQGSSTPSTLTTLSTAVGNVSAMKTGTDSWIEAQVGMSLETGDSVKTGDNSSAEITFFDGTTIELQAGTQIEIVSLDISTNTGSTTITLQQTIGTTISRVTKLLDPGSSYKVETPTGVAAVRGSMMMVRIIFNDPNYEDGTVLITNLEGHIYFIGHGEELQLPEGAQVIANNETAQLVQLSLAADDSVTTDEDTSVTVAAPGVLGNDSGLVVGDTLAVTAVDTSGTVGTLTAWGSDGSFTYDPNGQFEYLQAGSSTTDSFTYTVSDDYGITDTATVTINITGVNDPPVAVDDSAITDEDTPVTVAAPGVLNNDSDSDGDTLTVTAVNTSGTVGNVTDWGADGSFTYDPNGQFEYLQAGSSTTDSFTYTVSDGNGGTDAATVTITINGVNDAPTGISLNNSSVAEHQPSGTVVGDFSTTNPDTGDTFTYSLVSGEGDNDNASFNITDSQLQTAASFDYETKNSYSIRVRTSDSGMLYYEEAFNITVTNVNDPPVAVADNATTPENTPITIDVLNNDSDADGDILTVDSVTQGTNGSITYNATGVTYTPALNFTGTDSFNYTVSDGNGGTDTATVTIDILRVVRFPDEGTAYIGYEDQRGGDFDYNDFGMNMFIEEVYVDDCLTEISMESRSVVKLSGGNHDIHILRTLSNSTSYNYTVTRSTLSQGTETPAVTNASGHGNLDIILFDTSHFTSGDTVTIDIEITNGCEPYNSTPTAPRWDLSSIWAYYDPYMHYRTNPTSTRHIGDWQSAASPLPTQGYNVPYILVIPMTNWQAPGEGQCITNLYPYFDDYYHYGSPENWYE